MPKLGLKHVVGAAGAIAALGTISLITATPSNHPCISVSGLPDSNCTPGVADTSKTTTILCDSNYTTRSIRPNVQYTNNLKKQQIQEYGYSDTNTQDYEEDHLISLELGGSPTDPKNLWPEPYQEPNGAHDKDKVENLLHKRVCSGEISLQEAQREISTNWEAVK